MSLTLTEADLPHIEPSPRRIRVFFGREWIVDTNTAKYVWEWHRYPYYYFESKDVPDKYLKPSKIVPDKEKEAEVYDIVTDTKVAEGAAWKFRSGKRAGLTKIVFSHMDAWFEEDEQIFIHPKDPYKRSDVLQSSRHVRVEVNGIEVANTHKPRLLFETGLPARTYIPKTDCLMDLLEPSTHKTGCPYKGEASYYSVRLPDGSLVKDIIWWYPSPLAECNQIKGFVAFYDEKVDVWVDGVKQERPKTHFA